jgi:Transcriptional regulators
VIVPYLADPFFAEIARRIERRLIDEGYWPILFSAHGQTTLEIDALETLRSLKPAGALIAPLGRDSDLDAIRAFCDDVPTVLFDSDLDAGAAFIGSDNFQSIGLIVDYLCRTGEPPSFFEMPPVNPNAETRCEAYVRAMERLGHDPDVIHVAGRGWDFEEVGFSEGRRVLADRSRASDTILCSNDRLAIGLLAAAHDRGLRVGRGAGYALRIAGHDDHPFSRYTCPPLTTVSQDYAAIAEQSVGTLFALLEAGDGWGPRATTLNEGRLVMRGSA